MTRRYQIWTAAEVAKAKAMAESGTRAADIAKALGRTVKSVHDKVRGHQKYTSRRSAESDELARRSYVLRQTCSTWVEVSNVLGTYSGSHARRLAKSYHRNAGFDLPWPPIEDPKDES